MIDNIQKDTLTVIASGEAVSASDIASKLGITQSCFSNRANKLLEKSLVSVEQKGHKRFYSITEQGRQALQFTEPNENISIPDKLIHDLELLLRESFDGTYLFMDSFFEEPFPTLSLHHMRRGSELNARNSLRRELCNSLSDYICTAIEQKYTKNQFCANLLPDKHCSTELKGIIYYITQKYVMLQTYYK